MKFQLALFFPTHDGCSLLLHELLFSMHNGASQVNLGSPHARPVAPLPTSSLLPRGCHACGTSCPLVTTRPISFPSSLQSATPAPSRTYALPTCAPQTSSLSFCSRLDVFPQARRAIRSPRAPLTCSQLYTPLSRIASQLDQGHHVRSPCCIGHSSCL